LFFRRTGAFTRALGLWSPDALLHAIADLGDAERACKRTGAPDDLLCQRAVSRIAAVAASRKSRAELTPA
jgi:DNA polymerase-3 subunit delta